MDTDEKNKKNKINFKKLKDIPKNCKKINRSA